MKPWFIKEADIIKFPEPENKVIELPNVQSYPDFLTGVKDLHNRKAKGEISQDSHDRLYQDLIHRFMRKESFETPWFLRELAPDLAKKRVLAQLAKKGEDDPIFQKIYKDMIVGTPVQTRIESYIMSRKDNDAINNIAYLVKQIPSLTSNINELKAFLNKLRKPKHDFINLKTLVPSSGMTSLVDLIEVVSDPMAKELFSRMEKDLVGGNLRKGDKNVSDAGTGEGALAILSPSITFEEEDESAEEKGGDIRILGSKVEVKGFNGVLRKTPVDQSSVANFLNTQKGKFQLRKLGQTIRVKDLAKPKNPKQFTDKFDTNGFIDAVTKAWFGGTSETLKSSAHTPAFLQEWYKLSYDFYAKESGHTGILFLIRGKYCYCVSGEQTLAFATGQGMKPDHGTMYGEKVRQNPREMGIRIGIK